MRQMVSLLALPVSSLATLSQCLQGPPFSALILTSQVLHGSVFLSALLGFSHVL
jgi:hypothetical protein